MNKTTRLSAVLLATASVLFLSACGDDDNDPDATVTATTTATATQTVTPSPSPSATGEAAATDKVHLVCPAPVGEVDALTDPNDEWGAGYVIGSDTVLWPVEFGKTTGTDSEGNTFTEPGKKNPDPRVDPTDAIKCPFTGTFTFPDEDDPSKEITAKIKGTVWVVAE